MTAPTHQFPATAPIDRTSATDDERIEAVRTMRTPEDLIDSLPIRGTATEALVSRTRRSVHDILTGASDRLLVVIGPCSIHDKDAAIEYAQKLIPERERHAADLEILMRVYFEKPRTTVGWKGLINDPHLDGSFRIDEGLELARGLMVQLNEMGVPAGSEFLDVISPQYIGDLISWGAIGARTTESQVHRELASGLSSAIGFKNGTDGSVKIAVDAIQAARQKHHFLSVHKNGQVSIVETRGNADCHVILRGGKGPNYDAASVQAACADLAKAGLREQVMIDFSHANSNKDHLRQLVVSEDVAGQIASGDQRIMGVMVESNLVGGRQDLVPGKELVYGQSITDACVAWDDSVTILDQLAAAVRERRAR